MLIFWIKKKGNIFFGSINYNFELYLLSLWFGVSLLGCVMAGKWTKLLHRCLTVWVLKTKPKSSPAWWVSHCLEIMVMKFSGMKPHPLNSIIIYSISAKNLELVDLDLPLHVCALPENLCNLGPTPEVMVY